MVWGKTRKSTVLSFDHLQDNLSYIIVIMTTFEFLNIGTFFAMYPPRKPTLVEERRILYAL